MTISDVQDVRSRLFSAERFAAQEAEFAAESAAAAEAIKGIAPELARWASNCAVIAQQRAAEAKGSVAMAEEEVAEAEASYATDLVAVEIGEEWRPLAALAADLGYEATYRVVSSAKEALAAEVAKRKA